MLRQFRLLEPGEFIVVGCDTSAGGVDFSAAQFLSKTRLDVPMVYHSRNTTGYMTDELVTLLEQIYDDTNIPPVVAYETNNGGSFEIDRLAKLNKLNKYKIYMQQRGVGTISEQVPVKLGWTTSSATRPKMLQDLKEAIDNHLIRVYDGPTINEMFSFVISQTATTWRAQAEQGSHDDLIMSLAIAWQLYQTEKEPVLSSKDSHKVAESNRQALKKWGLG